MPRRYVAAANPTEVGQRSPADADEHVTAREFELGDLFQQDLEDVERLRRFAVGHREDVLLDAARDVEPRLVGDRRRRHDHRDARTRRARGEQARESVSGAVLEHHVVGALSEVDGDVHRVNLIDFTRDV